MDFKNKEKHFEIVVIDIYKTVENSELNNDPNDDYDYKFVCINKNMYDNNFKYCCISYRWGEVREQLVKTNNYIANVTSFHLKDLYMLCCYIKNKFEIKYLWIDSISINQSD